MNATKSGGQGRAPSGYQWDGQGNLQPIRGGPADPATKASQGNGGITTKMRNDAVAANQSFENLNSSLADYKKIVSEGGINYAPGAYNDKLIQARTNLQLQMKELYNLGVLNGPDLGLMQQMIFDPSVSLMNPIDAAGKIYSALGGPNSTSLNDRSTQSIDRVVAMLKTIRDNKTKNILDENGQFSGGDKPQNQGGDPITEANLPNVIQDAQDAIASGADPEAIIQELIQQGVDEGYARTLTNGQ